MASRPDAPAPAKGPTLAGLDLDTLLDALADRVVARLAATIATATDPAVRWADASSNPLESARAFLDAGRRGDFPTFKRGRSIVAKWGDVEAYIERRKVARAARSSADELPPAGAPASLAEVRARVARAAARAAGEGGGGSPAAA